VHQAGWGLSSRYAAGTAAVVASAVGCIAGLCHKYEYAVLSKWLACCDGLMLSAVGWGRLMLMLLMLLACQQRKLPPTQRITSYRNQRVGGCEALVGAIGRFQILKTPPCFCQLPSAPLLYMTVVQADHIALSGPYLGC
jgi:hypothetical protein